VLLRDPHKPIQRSPAKPTSIIAAQVEGSGAVVAVKLLSFASYGGHLSLVSEVVVVTIPQPIRPIACL
jgi:hypothetical protein